jgi:hypothetical protein
MKYLSDLLFWLAVFAWPFSRQSVQGQAIQTITDAVLVFGVLVTLFKYWKLYRAKKR